jgi:hypothetical protein
MYDIYIVTGIKEKFKECRIKNLYNIYNIDFTNKIFCTGGMFNDKSNIITKINPILYADDTILHLIKLLDNKISNISLYYIDLFNKYNLYKNKYNVSNIIKLNNLEELNI